MPLPLHIFEERYRVMIRRCLEEEIEFGVLLSRGKQVESLGTLARIDSVINRYEDGRLDILTVGTERIKVEEFHTDQSYLQGVVRPVRDETVEDPKSLEPLASEAIESLEAFAEEVGYTLDRTVLNGLDFEELSFFIASTDLFSVEEKQKLLALRDTGERLKTVAAGLREGVKQRKQTEEIRKIVGEDQDITHLFN